MSKTTVRLGSHGRLVIPVEYRRALGVDEGDELIVRFEDGELRLTTRELAVARARALVRRYAGDASLAAELIGDRRTQSREEAEAP